MRAWEAPGAAAARILRFPERGRFWGLPADQEHTREDAKRPPEVGGSSGGLERGWERRSGYCAVNVVLLSRLTITVYVSPGVKSDPRDTNRSEVP